MAAGRARRAASGLGWWTRRGTQVVKGLVAACVLGGFLCHLSFNLHHHLEGKTFLIASEETYPHARFPPFRFCIWPPWNPKRLVSLGLNTSNLTYEEIEDNFYQLTGVFENLSGRQLVKHAAWPVEDLIEEVKVGNIHEVYDSSTPFTSQLWRRSFTPIGPCLTLTPPPFASLHAQNLSIKLREMPAGIEPCRWVEEGRVRQYGGPEDCPAARRHCNTSCEWQDFLVNFIYVAHSYLLSTSDTYWINELKTALRIDRSQSTVVVEPFKVFHLKENGPADAEACYHECVMAVGVKEAKCKALTNVSLDEPISSLCVTPAQQYKLSYPFITNSQESDICLDNCKSSRKILKWKYSLEKGSDSPNGVIKLRLAKPSTLILEETEMYPLSQFLSDTGGGLGLFLGVCALDGWNFLMGVLVSREVVARGSSGRTLGRLGQLVGALVVSMATCTHLLIMGKSYLQQPVTLSVSLTATASDTSHAARPVTPESLVVERMASRVLGCRASSTPEEDECVKCVLQGALGQSLPFISIDDLPLCTAEHLTFPRLTFTEQKIDIERIASRDTAASCLACDHLNDSRPSDSVRYSVNESSPYSPNTLLCTVGGLLSLYFGLSFMSIKGYCQATLTKHPAGAGGRCRGVAWLGFTVGVVAVAVASCFLQLGTFFVAHPVYRKASTHSLQEGVMPYVTTCIWPPFNIRRLLETAGLDAAFANLSLMTDLEARDAVTILLLQDLQETSNVTDPRIIWDAGAWTDKEVDVSLSIRRGSDSLKTSKLSVKRSILNRCVRHTPSVSLLSSPAKTEYVVKINVFQDFGLQSYILSYLHYPDEVPLIEPNILTNVSAEAIDVSAVTKWRALYGSEIGDRGACVSRCLEAALATHLGCALPSDENQRDFDPCNMTVFASFLTTLYRLRTRPQSICQNLIGPKKTSMCHAACRHGSQTYFKFMSPLGTQVTSGLSFGVTPSYHRFHIVHKFTTGFFELMSGHDGYTTAMLISDLGGIISMTLGVSLLSLLLTLVSKIKQSQRTLTRVSGALPQ